MFAVNAHSIAMFCTVEPVTLRETRSTASTWQGAGTRAALSCGQRNAVSPQSFRNARCVVWSTLRS